KSLLEIGSGWYPTFPLACYLAGAARVTTVDLNRHQKPELLMACAERLQRVVPLIAQASGTDENVVQARHARMLTRLRDCADLADATDGVVDYLAPADASRTGFTPNQIDGIFSNSVLEHVPETAISAIYREAQRVLVPGGIMFHSVNCGDHYAYVDRSIHQLHYLRYSDAQWAFWNNAFLHQNRLRAHVFVELAEHLGFEIVLNTAHATPLRLEQLAALPVHARFAEIEPARLCITSVDFIARKPVTASAPAAPDVVRSAV
ncbi:MAG: class I SAM-dependent methyltransferase, partial [Dokdonella sp.]